MTNNIITGIGVAAFVGGIISRRKDIAGIGIAIMILGAFL